MSKELTRICKACGKSFSIPIIGKNIKVFSKRQCCSKSCINKLKEQTFLKKYGVKNISQAKDIKEQKKHTTFMHFGVNNPSQSKIIKKIKQEKQNITTEKRKVTCIKKYGVENAMQLDKNRKLVSQRSLGNTYSKGKRLSEEVKKHKLITEYFTKKKNKSFKRSLIEKTLYQRLLSFCPSCINQYRSKEYPFNCDFYIPEINLYIEYQGTWTHGGKPFENTEEDLQKLYIWKEKSKSSKFYENAINVWTKRDPLKRQTAKENNLNWIEFFNENEFNKWLAGVK